MTALHTLLSGLPEDVRARGRAFERLCKWYLQNDPVYRARLKTVWLWKDWPGRWGADAGIDLVAEGHDGKLWAIQAKAYDPSYSVTKRDIDTFLSESARPEFSYRLLVATTNRIGTTALRTLEAQEKHAGLRLLADLEAADLEWPASLDDLRAPRLAPKTPRPHQEEALSAVCEGFQEHDRGQLIMACGTGKTLVALWTMERLEAERTLVLVPSLSLLGQTLDEWAANASRPFEFLAVCSDETVVAEDHMVSHTADLGVPVTTEPDDIASFLEREGRRVIFATYQSSPRIAEAMGRMETSLDLVVADEAHRVAGPVSSEFATVLDPTRIRSKRRLFMTATPRYFTGRVRRVAGEEDFELASMDDPEQFGPVFHRLTFGEAIGRDLLSDYQVVIVGVDDPTYRAYVERGTLVSRDGNKVEDARTLAAQIGLAKAARDHDLRRIISFHGRVKKSRDFAASFPDVVSWMPDGERLSGAIYADYVSGEMPAGARKTKLAVLRHTGPGERCVLSNARCLAEGVDVPALDGVAFIDPRRSTIDIAQAVGRAIRKSEEKTVGTIVLPVFIEQTEDTEAALGSSVFNPVWDVLRALRAHDETLAEQLDAIRRELGRRTGGAVWLPGRIVLDIPSVVGQDFVSAFEARLVEQSTANWEFWYGLLLAFVERERHARVLHAHREGYFRLGYWVVAQRQAHAKGQLNQERVGRLEKLPRWSWDPVADDWEEGFEALIVFVERERHARVPVAHREGDFPLGAWARRQRHVHAKGQLSLERAARLETLPRWSWDPVADDWEEGFQNVQVFVAREGHARVPVAHREGDFPLGAWAGHQRQAHAKGQLSPERAVRLQALPGWSWDPYTDAWDEGFKALTAFVEREGHARAPVAYLEGDFRLGAWISRQRHVHAKGQLSAEQAARLEALPGWSWDPVADDWEEGFRNVQAFVAREGHARAPVAYLEGDFRLGGWMSRQRQAHAKGRLSLERTTRLERLPGWSWDPHTDAWDEGFKALTAFVEREGHARVPVAHREDDFRLGQWVAVQRQAHAKGQLSPERAVRLQAQPGWSWDPVTDAWEEGFRRLTAFVEREGHARVPQSHRDNDFRLGAWVANQRQGNRTGKLSAERAARLAALDGWTWSVGSSG